MLWLRPSDVVRRPAVGARNEPRRFHLSIAFGMPGLTFRRKVMRAPTWCVYTQDRMRAGFEVMHGGDPIHQPPDGLKKGGTGGFDFVCRGGYVRMEFLLRSNFELLLSSASLPLVVTARSEGFDSPADFSADHGTADGS